MKKSICQNIILIFLYSCLNLPEVVFSRNLKDFKNEKAISGTNYRGDFQYQKIKIHGPGKKYFKDMKVIDGGTFAMGRNSSPEATAKDSNLITNIQLRRVTVASFYISDHEITNGEYREFVRWVTDSVQLSILAQTDEFFYTKNTKLLNWSKVKEVAEERYQQKLAPYFQEKMLSFEKSYIDTKYIVYKMDFENSNIQIPVLLDTLAILKDFSYVYYESIANKYFSNPQYNNYPVVGISYSQACAYCDWLTKKVNLEICKEHKISYQEAIKNNNENLIPPFRLPTEAEWEYAALGLKIRDIEEVRIFNNLFPWQYKYLTDNRGNFLANFGPIYDQNGFQLKEYQENDKSLKNRKSENNYRFTSPVKSYPSNGYGLFDMAGNVSEWVLDKYSIQDYGEKDRNELNLVAGKIAGSKTEEKQSFEVLGNDNEHIAMKKIVERQKQISLHGKIDTTGFSALYWIKKAKSEIHDAQIREKTKNPRIVKGGSWVNGPVYLQCGSREIYSEDVQKSWIGFRVAMSRLQLNPKK